ncbi:MAG: hypothetical protein DMF79_03660 [Acidobacteria bacterium]|nr:MAG: hypothetical protein DMF79_03660 [Acidobacteriota bacterium]
MRRLSESSRTMRSWRSKMAERAPSSFTVWTIVPVSTSVRRAVTRTISPARWKPPLSTQRAPRTRPSSTARVSSSSSPGPPSRRRTSCTRSRAITVSPSTHFRSVVTVSAIPVPSQSSSPLRVMLAKLRTATARERGAAGGAASAVVPRRTAWSASETARMPG